MLSLAEHVIRTHVVLSELVLKNTCCAISSVIRMLQACGYSNMLQTPSYQSVFSEHEHGTMAGSLTLCVDTLVELTSCRK